MKTAFTLTAALLLAQSLSHAEFTVEKTASGGAIVKIDGKVFAEYVVDQSNKPYLWPVYGPTGKSMTRSYPMKDVPGEKQDHPHHRGICFGHEDIAGFDTWAEAATFEEMAKNPKNEAKAKERMDALGSQKHREFKELKGGPDSAVIVSLIDYVDKEGRKLFEEERRMTFRSDGETRSIDFDQDLIASVGEIHIDDKKDSGLSIRVPHSMSVDAKEGGQMVNSAGQRDADAWGKRADWCDYHGPVEGELLGVAMLNHPSSFRHPTPWHIRTYGLFTANPFGTNSLDKDAPNGAFDLKLDERLKLRHRFILHRGDEKTAAIAAAYEAYAKEPK